MATTAEQILLSLDVYENTSRIPSGWTRIAQRNDSGSGFFGAAYSNGSEIVVAFRGWNDAEPTDAVDVLRAYENGPFEQIGDAQRFLDQVRAANPGVAISLTGHSLGGGLAAITAVRNNLLATSFGAIETVDAALESMNGHREKLLGITLWDIPVAPFNTGITRAQLSAYPGVQNYAVFGEIATFNNRSAEGSGFIGQDTYLLPGLGGGIYEDDSVFGRWEGLTGEVWSSLVPVEVDGAPFSVDFSAQLHSMGFTALPMLFPAEMAALTVALPRLVLQLTNDYLARDSEGVIPWRMTYDALDGMVFDHLLAPASAATVLEAMMADFQEIAASGPASVVIANKEVNTAILQLAIEHAARETLDGGVLDTAGSITGGGVYIAADLGLALDHTPEGTRLLRNYANFLIGDAANIGGAAIIAGTGRVMVEANNGAGAAFNGSWTAAELIFGGQGNDAINSFAANDGVFGFGGRDRLWGHAGNDLLSGGEAVDALYGGPGNDILIGGALNDQFIGGDGGDTFVFDALGNGATGDVIADFAPVDDTLAFDNAVFTGLGAAGALASSALAFGGLATTAAHRFVYNSVNGVLLYDADGSGAGAAIRIATLTSVPVLTSADFLII
jgi:acetyl esterase/lipase